MRVLRSRGGRTGRDFAGAWCVGGRASLGEEWEPERADLLKALREWRRRYWASGRGGSAWAGTHGRRSLFRDPSWSLLAMRELGVCGPALMGVDDSPWADARVSSYLAFSDRVEEVEVVVPVAARPRQAGGDANCSRR